MSVSIVQYQLAHSRSKGLLDNAWPKCPLYSTERADNKYCICDNHSDFSDYSDTTLGDYLSILNRTTNAENREYSDISITVKPPRYIQVLASHSSAFLGQPKLMAANASDRDITISRASAQNAHSKGYSYRMTNGFLKRYPELFCSCSNAEDFQVCPFRMGY